VLIGKIHRLFPFGSNKNTPEFAGYRNKINDAPIINPRVGFNYNIDDAGKYIERWIGFIYGNLYGTRMNIYLRTKYYNIDYRPTGALDLTGFK
jgi:hypothetical protein